jgi:hypothetical protein
MPLSKINWNQSHHIEIQMQQISKIGQFRFL